ncbi:MAG: triose-phosphate isomerase [Pseudomonadota bacterium]
MKRLIAGNWKMNGLRANLDELSALRDKLTAQDLDGADVLICPPATLLGAAASLGLGEKVALGGQDCHAAENGAHTGDLGAEMLAEAGATAVIVGHSERRADHGETNDIVKAKAEAAHRAGLLAIVCVGETQEEREAGKAIDVVSAQVAGSMPSTRGPSTLGTVAVAYEPVWAIGTGLTASVDDIATMHGVLREAVGGGVRLLYGGSVKPANATEILSTTNVNGALVGGAILTAEDFYGIITA